MDKRNEENEILNWHDYLYRNRNRAMTDWIDDISGITFKKDIMMAGVAGVISAFTSKILDDNISKEKDKEIEAKNKEIERLLKENEALRYRPGNQGYIEAMEDFDLLRKGEKK